MSGVILTWSGTHGTAVSLLEGGVRATWSRALYGEAHGFECILGTDTELAGRGRRDDL